jgi:O-antigen/teichoic acid export membrane protein
MSEDERNKRIAKNTLMLYIRMLFMMVVSLYTSRVVLKTLGVVDFGINNVVGGVVVLFGFFNSSLSMGTQRFLTFYLGKGDNEALQDSFSVSLIMHAILSGLILIIAETIGLWFLQHKLNIPVERKSAAFWVYQFSVLASIVSILQVPYNASIIARERMNIYAYVSIVEVSLKLVIVYFLTITAHDKLACYAALVLLVHIIIISIYRMYCIKKYHECRFRLIIDKSLYKPILTFSGWMILNTAANASATQGVNILLNIFFGPTVNAARAVSMQVNNAVLQFVTNFQMAINPNIIKLYATEKKSELYRLVFQNAKYSFCLMWVFVLPLLLKIDVILAYWLTEVPEYTGMFCRIILMQSLVSCLQRPIGMTVQAYGDFKQACIIVSLIFVMVLPISYFLLRLQMPPYMPFVISLTAYILEFLQNIIFLYNRIHFPVMQLLRKVFYPILLIVVCSLPISVLASLYFKDGFISLLLVIMISVISVLVPVYFIAVSREMRKKIIAKYFRVFLPL